MEVGIDFGTTFSTICYSNVREGRSACLEVAGSVYIPTEIFISSEGWYNIGNRAKTSYLSGESGDYYANPKRWIGANSINKHLYINRLNPTHSVDNDGKYSVYMGGTGGKRCSITTLVALFIRAMMIEVETLTGNKIIGVVCSVPANYNSFKRSYLAVALGALKVPLRALINEPTAAALYGVACASSSASSFGIFDFGGGTFDVSFVCRRGLLLGVVGSEGDNYLGGRDIDKAMFRTLRSRLKGTISDSKLAIYASGIKEVVADFGESQHLLKTDSGVESVTYDRKDLDNDSRPFVERAIKLFEKGFKEVGSKNIVVVLTGGSSALPLVREMCQTIKGVSEVVFYNDTFRASVALGCKVYSDILKGDADVRLVDALSQSLSDELNLFHSSVVFPKGCAIPNKRSATYTVSTSLVPYGIFEGECLNTYQNEMTFKSIDNRGTSSRGNTTVEYNLSVDGRLSLVVDGRVQVNELVPPPPDASVLALTYSKASEKYLKRAATDYAEGLKILTSESVSVDDVIDNTGVVKSKEIEENFESHESVF
nr:HSP70-like protein [Lingue ampelovirus 1]